jgi:hypothetical protein
MEIPFYQTTEFRSFLLVGAIFCLISVILNYRIIRKRKPGNTSFAWSTLLWGLLGWYFPVISTVVLHFLTKDREGKQA